MRDSALRSPLLVLGLLLLGATIWRGVLLFQDIQVLLNLGLIQDDAFYYYVIAKYWHLNGVPSFDGIHPTNGFHPLWQFISLAVFNYWDGEIPIRVMLVLGCLLDLCSLGLVYMLLQRIGCRALGTLAAVAILALHGTIIRTWFNGLETALHITTLLLVLWQWLRVGESAHSPIRQHVWLGAFAALAFLSRTDSAIIVTVMFAFLYIPRLAQRQWLPGFTASVVVLLICSPWLIWNLMSFGSIVQISGQIEGNVWLVGATETTDAPWYQELLYSIGTSIPPLGNVVKKMFVPFPAQDLVGYVFLLPLGILTAVLRRRNNDFRTRFNALMPFLLGIVLLFLYHAGVRHFVRGWYNAPMLLAITFVLALMLDVLLQRWRQRPWPHLLWIGLCLTLCFAYSPYDYLKKARKGTHPGVLAAQWINEHVEADAIIGAANAGIMGYYAQRPVVNLDGVVNESAFRARTTNQLHRYIYESHIGYLADHTGSMVHLCATNPYYRCEVLTETTSPTLVARVVPIQSTP